MNSLTPITDINHKTDIIEHVNQDHIDELLAIAQSHYTQGEILSAKILDIYQEGVKIAINSETKKPTEELFVPFEIEGDLEDKILYLAYAAIVKQGRNFGGNNKRFFEVIDKQPVTRNIVRLTLKSATPLPDYYPGYAYAFLLKSMKQRPQKDSRTGQKKSWSKSLFDHFFVWLMKHQSSNNRQKLMLRANKDIRLYTLRKAWESSEQPGFIDTGYVDVFQHDDTPGSLWVNALTTGDIIMSRSEVQDKHPHLKHGQALLIADETAYPALAGILEYWNNPLPPQVILLSSAEDDQRYFDESQLPSNASLHRIICSADKQGDEVLKILEKIEHIEVVWAAFESESAKKVRHYLRNQRQIIGKNNHTKAYWSLKSKRGAA